MTGWLALDIGGANLKAADGLGYTASTYFPLWQRPEQLPAALRAVIAQAPPTERLVVTMTGELADCFRTKAEGVRNILTAIEEAAGQRLVEIYLTCGEFVTPAEARREPLAAAAANWHALARFAGRFAPTGCALAIDIGSTTTDIVPLVEGIPRPTARTDPDRLAAGELVYTGVERSPICAVVDTLPWRDRQYPVAQELFATTWDAYLLLAQLPESPDETHTADGRPATMHYAWQRMTRMLCADSDMMNLSDAKAAAAAVRLAQLDRLKRAAEQVMASLPAAPTTCIVSGRGEFLAPQLSEQIAHQAALVSFSRELGPDTSRCATAHALAVLARERAGD